MTTTVETTPGITSPRGFYAAGTACGIKPSGKRDLTVIWSETLCAAAGVFTTSLTPAEPITVTQKHLQNGRAQAIVVNAGNANASTGKRGERDALTMCKLTAKHTQIATEDVLVCSTGIIGVPLPMDYIKTGIPALAKSLDSGAQADDDAAHAILTTDLVPKSITTSVEIDGHIVVLSGICKGSGMIAPNMATMLGFITTDAAISPAALRRALKQAATASFNRISVDQHTSCSDAVLVLANGQAGNKSLTPAHPDYQAFVNALTRHCRYMAESIVRDGEGATRIFEVTVTNAKSEKEADLIAKTIVNSPLVKCAIHGSDPNWGRITTAAGMSGAKGVVPAQMTLTLGERGKKGIVVYRKGNPVKLSTTAQDKLNSAMRSKEIGITLDMGIGESSVQWLGCDLSREYITINADYTT